MNIHLSKVCIVIPIYQSQLNDFEKQSIQRCFDIIGHYPIRIITSKKHNFNQILELKRLPKDIRFEYFNSSFFKNPQTYNKLLKSIYFFKRFRTFEYLLMHHTDSYVFSDKLIEWCRKGYDYIGAPVYEYDGTLNPNELLFCGNGGFSIHKVNSAIRILKSYKRVYPINELNKWYLNYNWKGRIKFLPYYLLNILGLYGNSHYLLNYSKRNEDEFWGKFVPNAFEWYKVAPFGEAYQFSMEYNCENLYKLNNMHLPFGAHQWYKPLFYDFWKDKINIDTTNRNE